MSCLMNVVMSVTFWLMAEVRAIESMSSAMSTPRMWPLVVGVAVLMIAAAARLIRPVPHPRSRTLFDGWIDAHFTMSAANRECQESL